VLEEEKKRRSSLGTVPSDEAHTKSDPSVLEYEMTGGSSRKDTTLCDTLSGWRMSSRNDKETDIVGYQVVEVSICQP
jgi:hypothetical protein